MSEYVYTTEGAFGLRECTGEEIVRCKDCVYYEKHGSFVMCMLPDGDGGYACWIVEPDGFCAWGERKSELDLIKEGIEYAKATYPNTMRLLEDE